MGIFVALTSALAVSVGKLFIKKLSGLSPHVISWIRMASALPVLALVVSVFSSWQAPPPVFWVLVVGLITPLEIAFLYLGAKALHLSDLSVVGPLGATTSLFLVPVGFLVLGEVPSLVGLGGVALIVAGAFSLGRARTTGMRRAASALLADRGSLFALLAAFLASVSISVTKLTYSYTPPLLAAFYIVAVLVIVLTPFALRARAGARAQKPRDLIGLGLSSGISVAVHHLGLSLLPAAYFISIKRLSLVFSVFIGKRFFKEEHIRERLLGSVLMVLGVLLIALG